MRPWQYRLERIGHPITRYDAEMEDSLTVLRQAAANLAQVVHRTEPEPVHRTEPEPEVNLAKMQDLLNDALGVAYSGPPRCAEDRLNELGREGWELVGIFVDTSGPVAVFKRPE
jgi:hypothetical protein